MCGILFTNFDISNLNINHVIEFLQKRGPDLTNIKKIREYTFVHTLLSMTGPLTEQPFFNSDNSVICIYNGEIYNFEEFGEFRSDGECLIPLYEKYGDEFISKLDGEFAVCLVDFNKNKLILSTDIFGTRPLWIGFDDKKFGISTYKSCLDRINLSNNFQVLANKTYIIDLINIRIIEEKRVHTFDLRQYKTNFNDWNKAFSESIRKRTKYAKCGIFIGLSGGYDSGAIACELTKQNVNFTAYSIANVEDKNVLNQRAKIIKDCNIINLERDKFLEARDFLKKNAEEYKLNIDNGEKEKYDNLINTKNYNKNNAEQLLKLIEFRKNGQILTDDNGAVGCSYICSLAIKKNKKIYLSGSGADEIFSDYGFNKVKIYDHSTIGGYFSDNLSDVFPWKNFFHNTQRAYLMKEEHTAGAYGIEGRYPFLDKYVVQEFLWITSELKNSLYKAPIDNYLSSNNFPYEKNQKIGFGCGFNGPTNNNQEYSELSNNQKKNIREKKVIEMINYVNIDDLSLMKTKSFENYYLLKNELFNHVKGNCYSINININDFGLKYQKKSRYIVEEDNIPLNSPVTNHSLIWDKGNGLYCFWTSNTLYLSTSDNSDPRTNNRKYSIIKLNNNLRKLEYINGNSFNTKNIYIAIVIKNCIYNSDEYFNIRKIFSYYNFIPNALICDDYDIFMDIPNIKFLKYNELNNCINNSRLIITSDDLNIINIDIIREKLFDEKYYDDNYTIKKGKNPLITMFILSIGNHQFKYALESCISQNIDCYIIINKYLDVITCCNSMIKRSKTDYYIQVDEDMIFLDNDCANIMYNNMINQDKNIYMNYYYLNDAIFGEYNSYDDKVKKIFGIKIFNRKLLYENKLYYDTNNNFMCDRIFSEKLKLHNFISIQQYLKNSDIIGYHQKNYSNFDLFIRSLKIGHELFKYKTNSAYEYNFFGYILSLYNFDELIYYIYSIIVKCSINNCINKFIESIKLIKKIEFNYCSHHFNKNNINNIDKIKNININTFKNKIEIEVIKNFNYYCLCGILFSIYYDYEYNYKKYPYDFFRKNFE
jgi:asparagine synthetase B (glutamine-hydrolysing)